MGVPDSVSDTVIYRCLDVGLRCAKPTYAYLISGGLSHLFENNLAITEISLDAITGLELGGQNFL
jgi:hypothetical protein